VVVPCDEGLSTPAVYREFDRLRPDVGPTAHQADPAQLIAALDGGDDEAVAVAMRNDLEDAALVLRPELAERMAEVQAHCGRKVMLSGSGPTILSASGSQEEALGCREALLEAGFEVVHVATGPVAGAHVVEYA
jgi:4-diphosphocytidyl-2-C-methyl-D-erythritol kinase